MELDWTTFILELINFLVLMWILNRFLYKPVMNVIAQRKAAIQRTLSDAQVTRSDAQALQTQYENRLEEWEQEREKARAQLREEITAERSRLLEDLRAELSQEREKAAVVEQRRMKEFMQQTEVTAIAQGSTFASRLLSRLRGPELERKIVDMVMQDLPHLPDAQRQVIRSTPIGMGLTMKVTSAYPLDKAQREVISKACRTLAGQDVSCEFLEDRDLIAGLRISVGSWVLRANVQDELRFFTESRTHA
ncbi:MAG TPA: F0F1 ATP synthase subunit delta [Nitrospiraceae bacterium]|nr:F0F1 ATP synthase subunit delta [Nitrospiraceae bacterium]